MSKRASIHFLTAYVEYLLDQGIRSEEYYLGEASRFLRFLLANTTEEEVQKYINLTTQSPSYRAKLETSLRKFFLFAEEKLAINNRTLLPKKYAASSGSNSKSKLNQDDTACQ